MLYIYSPLGIILADAWFKKKDIKALKID